MPELSAWSSLLSTNSPPSFLLLPVGWGGGVEGWRLVGMGVWVGGVCEGGVCEGGGWRGVSFLFNSTDISATDS